MNIKSLFLLIFSYVQRNVLELIFLEHRKYMTILSVSKKIH